MQKEVLEDVSSFEEKEFEAADYDDLCGDLESFND